jgi:RHS repeat-associated protein
MNALNRQLVIYDGVGWGFQTSALNQDIGLNWVGSLYDQNFNLYTLNGWRYDYDADKHLVVTAKGSTAAQFVYDGLGRCVKRTINGVVTVITYDGWKPTIEWDWAGNMSALNVYGAGADEILYRYVAAGSQRFRYHHDIHGNVVALLDWWGNGLEKYSYDAFGRATITGWDGTPHTDGNEWPMSWHGNRFMFQGREYLSELGIYDYRHRMYNPALGRFLQTDPMGLQTEGAKLTPEQKALYEAGAPEAFGSSEMNLFHYCDDDPVDRSDSSGLITLLFPGFGPQRWGSNETFIEAMKKRFPDAVVFSRTQDGQSQAIEAVHQARKDGDNMVNLAGYSRGVVAALQTAAKLGKEGISVNRLVGVDPVTVTGNNGSIAVPSNVKRADNFYQTGRRTGLMDFAGTPLRGSVGVTNRFIDDSIGRVLEMRVMHQNMPLIVDRLMGDR